MGLDNSQPAVRFEAVNKRFEFSTGRPQTIIDKIIDLVTRREAVLPRLDGTLWAVQDVSFEVMPGESLGIIGRNGSGKSTILKLATGIFRPTSGRVMVRGRLSALLELGAGFHPDLTGRENIFLNASILGMSKAEIERAFDAIVAFSELDQFIDMPVKHYSSGMYMRLGFSVAVHVKPDVLIVDEILAVGDQSFQTKCIDRIFDLKAQGVTIIMVSHNLPTLRSLCTHALWIEHGELLADGPTDEVIDAYLENQDDWQAERHVTDRGSFQRWGSHELELTDVRLLDENGVERSSFEVGRPMTIEMHYRAHQPIEEPEFGLAFFRQDGTYVSGPDNQAAGFNLGVVSGAGVVRYRLRHLPLLPSLYRLTAAIYNTEGVKPYDHHEKAYPFRVITSGAHKRKGLIEMPAEWEIAAAQESPPAAKAPLEVTT
jgi:lipopolysaccharide transport system ATP-binding protein